MSECKRNWRVIFANGKGCTMLLMEPVDDLQAYYEAYSVFMVELRVE